MILQVVGSWRWVTAEINFLLKRLAIDYCLVRVLVPKKIGLMSGGFEFFPDIFPDILFMRRQNLLMSDLWMTVDNSVFHVSLASRQVSLVF